MTPPLDPINVGGAANDGTGDPLRTAFQRTNTAIGAVDDIQTTLGVATGSEALGDVENISNVGGANLSLPADTVKKRVDKHESRIYFLEQEEPVSGGGFSALADNFNLVTVTETTRGTTLIDGTDTAISAQYPFATVGIWIIEVRPSSEIAGSGWDAAELVHITAARVDGGGDARVFTTVRQNTVLADWIDMSGVPQTLLTQDERAATHFEATTDGDWRNLVSGGFWTLTVTAGGATNAFYPYVPWSGSVRYILHIDRVTDTSGVVTAFVTHGDRRGGIVGPRQYRANVTLSTSTSTTWITEPVMWQPTDSISQVTSTRALGIASAPHELWLKWGQSNAVGADIGAADQGAFEPFGIDAPDPRVFEVSRGARTNFETVPQYKPQILRAPAADDSGGGIGFGQAFGKKRADMQPGIKRVCISNRAVGGAGLVGLTWDPTTDPVGTDWEAAIDEAAEFLDRNPEFVFAGIIWHQGETDVTGGKTRAEYESVLGSLIDMARARLRGGDSSVFLCGSMLKSWRDGTGSANSAEIHAAHANIATLRPRCAFVDFDDLSRNANDIHFGRDDLRTMGRRYAVAADGLVDFSATAGIPSYKFEWDGIQFSNSLGTGGTIYDQKFTNDPDRGWVLDTNPTESVVSGDWTRFPVDAIMNGDKYTIAMFVRPRAEPASTGSFFSGASNEAGKGHYFVYGRICHGVYADGTGAGLGYTLPEGDLSWVHIAITYDGTQVLRYINGVLTGAAITATVLPLDAPSDGSLGGAKVSAGFTINSLFDKFVLAPYVMTADAIAALAAE